MNKKYISEKIFKSRDSVAYSICIYLINKKNTLFTIKSKNLAIFHMICIEKKFFFK